MMQPASVRSPDSEKAGGGPSADFISEVRETKTTRLGSDKMQPRLALASRVGDEESGGDAEARVDNVDLA